MPDRLFFPVLILILLAGCTHSRGVYHVVAEGQTLYRIGHAYQVDQYHLARINRIKDPTLLRIGERLFIPGASQVKIIPVTPPPKPSSVGSDSSVKRVPVSVEGRREAPVRTPDSSVSARVVSPPKLKGGVPPVVADKFIWPAVGTVVRRFGESEGELCQGLQISLVSGSPVLSAAAGRVTFSGDQIKGYGNLIILKHEDTFFTVYGMNAKNLVEVGSQVKKGEKIALSGQRLHFEIRHGKSPVNPFFYLP